MKYDFDSIVDRRGTNCVKWDTPNNVGVPPGEVIPMWVADMDFRTAPCIIEALRARVEHGVFGYTAVPDSYYDAVIQWFSRRRGWSIQRDWIMYTTAVVPALSVCIKAFTEPGDKVVFITPAYNCFFSSVRNAGCICSESPVIYSRSGGVVSVSVDWADIERRCADPAARVLLLCNPHNPVGRVWTREELLKVGEICLKHNVFVISDEIHCELTYPGHDYTPWATLPEEMVRNSVSCISPTKAFNIAGIQIANIFASDPDIHARMVRAISENECRDVNVFGVAALKAAYNHGEAWLDELREYLWDNARTVYCFLEDNLPGVVASPLEGTYLMWLDFRRFFNPTLRVRAQNDKEKTQNDNPGAQCNNGAVHIPVISSEARNLFSEGFSERLAEFLEKEAGVKLSTGTIYGAVAEGWERLNIACPRKVLLEGLERLAKGLHAFAAKYERV